MNVREYHRAVNLTKMRRLMDYGVSQYKEDWEVAKSLAMLMASGNKEHLESMLEGYMDRILAFNANNPDVLPFNYYPIEGLYDSD